MKDVLYSIYLSRQTRNTNAWMTFMSKYTFTSKKFPKLKTIVCHELLNYAGMLPSNYGTGENMYVYTSFVLFLPVKLRIKLCFIVQCGWDMSLSTLKKKKKICNSLIQILFLQCSGLVFDVHHFTSGKRLQKKLNQTARLFGILILTK